MRTPEAPTKIRDTSWCPFFLLVEEQREEVPVDIRLQQICIREDDIADRYFRLIGNQVASEVLGSINVARDGCLGAKPSSRTGPFPVHRFK